MAKNSITSFPGSAKSKLGSLKVPLLVVAVGAVSVGSYFVWAYSGFHQSNQAKSTAEAFVASVVSGQPDQAYVMTSDTVQQNHTKAEFEGLYGKLKSDNPQVTQEAIVTSSGGYDYQTTLTGLPANASGSTTGVFAIHMTKDGSSWAVDSVNVE